MVGYQSDKILTNHYPTNFLQRLKGGLARDVGAGFTTIGPHRDDFALAFKDAPITTIASRGEMRTVVLALKLGIRAPSSQLAVPPNFMFEALSRL